MLDKKSLLHAKEETLPLGEPLCYIVIRAAYLVPHNSIR